MLIKYRTKNSEMTLKQIQQVYNITAAATHCILRPIKRIPSHYNLQMNGTQIRRNESTFK